MARRRKLSMDRVTAIRQLAGWGYFGPEPELKDLLSVSDAKLEKAVRRYQKMHGLAVDGWIGPATAHKMNNPLRCGMPDLILEATCAWPMKRVTYLPKLRLPGLSDADAVRAFDEACAQWNAVCGIQLVRSTTASGNIVARSGTGNQNQLDGKGGTLAWSQMPCGAGQNTSLDQMYDEAEAWSYRMAVAVICHEVGHAIGLPHLANGNLLAPYYNGDITTPQAGDIREVVKRYGQPGPVTPTDPSALPPAEIPLTVQSVINGVTYRASGSMKPVASLVQDCGCKPSSRRKSGRLA